MAVKKLSSKALLSLSLNELLAAKKLDSITVTEITQNCGLSRKTFYNHFLDINDLVFWMFSSDMLLYINQIDDSYTWADATLDTYRLIKQKSIYYQEAIKKQGQNSLGEFVLPMIQEECVKLMNRHEPSIIVTDKLLFALRFYLHGTIASVNEWINGGFRESPEKLAENVLACMPALVKNSLNLSQEVSHKRAF